MSGPDGPHVGPMNFDIWVTSVRVLQNRQLSNALSTPNIISMLIAQKMITNVSVTDCDFEGQDQSTTYFTTIEWLSSRIFDKSVTADKIRYESVKTKNGLNL